MLPNNLRKQKYYSTLSFGKSFIANIKNGKQFQMFLINSEGLFRFRSQNCKITQTMIIA